MAAAREPTAEGGSSDPLKSSGLVRHGVIGNPIFPTHHAT